MIFPLIGYESISPLFNLFLALLIGIGFGFALEQAGLGNAKKLIAQFLLKDLAIFKVMFSAIVTAMVGLYFFSMLGLLNLDLIHFSDSYLMPQFIGGLLLGIGFVISGYCPGTTIVAIACGKIDAIYAFIGLLFGTLVFGLLFQWIESFYLSSHLKEDNLTQVLGWQYGSVVLVVILIAIVGFYFSEKIESNFVEAKPVEANHE